MRLKNKISNVIFLSLSIFIILQCISQKKINIYMIGDSTMAEYDSSRYPLAGWGMELPHFFNKNVTVNNFAKSGKSSKNYRDLGYWKTVQDSLKKGDYLFIQFGHNDEKEYDTTRYTIPGGSFNKNLKRYIKEGKAKGAIPVLLTPIRRRKFDKNGKLVDTHGKYPNAVRDVAKELNVHLIDLQKKTKSLYENYGVEGSKKLFLWVEKGEYPGYPEGNIDNTHFSKEGAIEICKLAADEIKNSSLGLKDYLIDYDDVKNKTQ